ncbi:hypothetical protein ACFVGV_05980 [Pseudarthrobacter scleromae]|uniref:hypothetical protein n=1 Tax=Pseudarthrobacter scleromae TaxID=158897 RepID=UPI00362A41E6
MSKIDILLSGPEALTQSGYFRKGRPEIHDFAISLSFRLGALPELGVLTLTSKSVAFASQLVEDEVRERLEEADGPAKATLEIKRVSFTAKRGERAGEALSYAHPILKILGSARSDAGGAVYTA